MVAASGSAGAGDRRYFPFCVILFHSVWIFYFEHVFLLYKNFYINLKEAERERKKNEGFIEVES